jgi:hypothetical protein
MICVDGKSAHHGATVATVLIKFPGRAFKKEMGQFDEFAHEGDQRHFARFACGRQTIVKGFQHRVAARRPVKRGAGQRPTMRDVSLAAL